MEKIVSDAAPRLGIVVIGRNEGQRLSDCLRSLGRNIVNTVYVDSGSTDDSIQFANKMGAKIIKLDSSLPFTAARARNAGFYGFLNEIDPPEFVQFIDGDCSLDPDWLQKSLEFLGENPQIVAVCGRRRERFPNQSVYNRLCDVEWNTPSGKTNAFGGDVLVRTAAVASVGGYRDDLISGEEPELCIRLRRAGGIIWRLDEEMTLHDAAMMRFGQWWRRNVRGGYGFARVVHLHHASPYGIWQREVLRATIYGGLMPIVALVSALFFPLGLAMLIIYPIQLIRIAFKRGMRDRTSWIYAFYVSLGKFPEFQGVVKYGMDVLRRKQTKLIEYKTRSP